jgi:hypothetical protein
MRIGDMQHAGNVVTNDWMAGVTFSLSGTAISASQYTLSKMWSSSLRQVLVNVNITIVGSYTIDILYNSAALPGSPVNVIVHPGTVSASTTTLTGVGVSLGEPGNWNPIRIVPKDAFGNTQLPGALPLSSLTLAFAPEVFSVKRFRVSPFLHVLIVHAFVRH